MVKSTAVKDTDRDAVDAVIEQLMPLLDKDDIVIDGGNSLYRHRASRRLPRRKRPPLHRRRRLRR
jgi:6-phosphogluconate dehydrogenase